MKHPIYICVHGCIDRFVDRLINAMAGGWISCLKDEWTPWLIEWFVDGTHW